jgi:hypothetical protein
LGAYVALRELTEEQVEEAVALLKRDEARLFPRDRRYRDNLIRFSKREISFLELVEAGPFLRPKPAPKPPEDEVSPPTTPPDAQGVNLPLTPSEPPTIDQPLTPPERTVGDQFVTTPKPAVAEEPVLLSDPPVLNPPVTPSAPEVMPGTGGGGALSFLIPLMFAIGVVILGIYFWSPHDEKQASIAVPTRTQARA